MISTECSLSELKPYKNNSKIHPEKQIKNIVASIKQFGFTQPIVCDEEKLFFLVTVDMKLQNNANKRSTY